MRHDRDAHFDASSVHVYFVEAPFQLISAISCRSRHLGRGWLVLRLGKNNKNNDQLLAVVQRLVRPSDFECVISQRATNHIEMAGLLLRVFLKKVVQRVNFFSIGVGDYRSGLARVIAGLFSCRNLILLDDGVASLGVYKVVGRKIVAQDFDQHSETHSVQKLFSLNKYFSRRSPSGNLLMHSFLNLPPSPFWAVEKGEISTVLSRARSGSGSVPVKVNAVFLLGSKVVEAGIINDGTYEDFCCLVAKDYVGFEVFYLPHREESDEKIARICRAHGFKLLILDLPFEVELGGLNWLPGHIVSLYSASLFFCKEIDSRLSVRSYPLPVESVERKFSESVKTCYAFLDALSN